MSSLVNAIAHWQRGTAIVALAIEKLQAGSLAVVGHKMEGLAPEAFLNSSDRNLRPACSREPSSMFSLFRFLALDLFKEVIENFKEHC